MPLVVWLVVGILLAVAEIFTTTFVLIMLSAGAFAAAVAAAAGLGVAGQAVVFAGVSTLSLLSLRPLVRKRFHRTSVVKPLGVQAIEGSAAVVMEEVDGEHGLVKIDGELWRARLFGAQPAIPAGERVRVVEVQGATVMVWRD